MRNSSSNLPAIAQPVIHETNSNQVYPQAEVAFRGRNNFFNNENSAPGSTTDEPIPSVDETRVIPEDLAPAMQIVLSPMRNPEQNTRPTHNVNTYLARTLIPCGYGILYFAGTILCSVPGGFGSFAIGMVSTCVASLEGAIGSAFLNNFITDENDWYSAHNTWIASLIGGLVFGTLTAYPLGVLLFLQWKSEAVPNQTLENTIIPTLTRAYNNFNRNLYYVPTTLFLLGFPTLITVIGVLSDRVMKDLTVKTRHAITEHHHDKDYDPDNDNHDKHSDDELVWLDDDGPLDHGAAKHLQHMSLGQYAAAVSTGTGVLIGSALALGLTITLIGLLCKKCGELNEIYEAEQRRANNTIQNPPQPRRTITTVAQPIDEEKGESKLNVKYG